MTAQAIKDGMSKGEWVQKNTTLSHYDDIDVNGLNVLNCYNGRITAKECNLNTTAICKAVNNTYNAGIDPEKVPEIIKALNDLLNNTGFKDSYPKRSVELKSLLESASLK